MADKANKKPEPNLVELGSILFILAVLFSVVLPAWEQVSVLAQEQTNLQKCQQNLLDLHRGIDAYRQAHNGSFPPTLGELVAEKILPEMPKCPSSEKQTYLGKGYQYKPGDPGRYTLMCMGSAHGELDLGLNEPLYDSLYGLRPPMKAISSPSPSPSSSPEKSSEK